MKKILVLVLSAIMAFATIGMVGCGKKDGGITELNVWVVAPLINNYSDVLKMNPNDKQALLTKEITQTFEQENPDIKLKYLNKGWGDTLNEALMMGLNTKGDSAPDIVVGEQYVKTFIDNGNFCALDLDGLENDIVGQATKYMVKDNNVYAVPITTGTYGLNINLSMLRECQVIDDDNIVVPEWRNEIAKYITQVNAMNSNYTCSTADEINPLAPVYFEDLLAICLFIRDFYDGKAYVNNVTYSNNDGKSKGGIIITETIGDAPWQNLAYMRNAGGDYVDANGDVNLDSPENLLAYQMIRDLYATAGTSGRVNSATDFNTQFFRNYGVYAIQGAELVTRAYKSTTLDDEDIVLTYLPMFSAKKIHSNTMVGSVFMSVNKNKSKNLEKSTRFIKYLLSEEVQYKFMEMDGRIPVRKSILESETIKSKSNYNVLEPLLKTYSEWSFDGMLYGFSNNASHIWESYHAFMSSLFSETDLATALKEVDGQMQYYLDREI